MAIEQFANGAATTLSAAITSTSSTSISVTSAGGFPSSGNFRILIGSELLLVTAVSGTTFTVTRGIESTTAATALNGAVITHVLTAGAITDNVPRLISTQILGSNQTTITFSSIPQTFNHLRLFMSGRISGAVTNDNIQMRFNSDTGANYNYEYLQGTSTSATAAQGLAQTSIIAASYPGASVTAGYCGASEITIYGYSSTTLMKTFTNNTFLPSGTGSGNFFTIRTAGIWISTAAITQIDLFVNSGSNFVTGSIFSLYGIP